CHPAAEGRPGDDLLLDEARHLVAGPAEAALGPVERQRRLPGDEVGEPGGVAEVGPAGAPPALAQLRGRCRLANHDPAAVRVPPEHPPLAEPAPRQEGARAAPTRHPGIRPAARWGAPAARRQGDEPGKRAQQPGPQSNCTVGREARIRLDRRTAVEVSWPRWRAAWHSTPGS